MSRRHRATVSQPSKHLGMVLRIMSIPVVLTVVLWGIASVHVAAQQDALVVTVTGVNSESFPQVTAYLDVRTADGMPVVGLSAEHVWIAEDGQPLDVPVTVASDTTQGVSWVLAVDVSLDAADMPEVQRVLGSFLGTMGAHDQVALLTFGTDVQTVYGFSEPAVVQDAVDGLVERGDYTNLNRAVVEAVSVAGQALTGNVSVVVLTDSADNAGVVDLDEAVDAVGQAGIPVHVIGFGPKMARPEAGELTELAMGENAYTFADVAESLSVLRAINVLMRQAYRVTFVSQFAADGQEHPFDVHMTLPGTSGESIRGSVQGQLVALSRPVGVRVVGVEDGQAVGGMVSLDVLVDAPAPLASVEYVLDDRSLTKVLAAPFGYLWDSSDADLGARVLIVRVVDGAGNHGETEVALRVVKPVVVSPVLFADRAVLGEQLSTEVQVSALEDISSVELYVDGRSVEKLDAGPDGLYRVSLDTAAYAAGSHTLTVRAMDELGQMAEWSYDTMLTAPPTPTPAPTLIVTPTPVPWQEQYRMPVLGGAMVLAAAMAIALLAMIARGQRLRRQTVYHLELENGGNVVGRYRLRVDSPGNELSFKWMLDGVELDRMPETVEQGPEVAVEERAPVPAKGGRIEGAADKARRAGAVGSGLADLAGTASHLMPGAAGSSLQRLSSQIRSGRAKISRTRATVSQTRSTVKQTRSKISRPAKRVRPKGAGRRRDARPVLVSTWHVTPPVEPGEIVTLDLVVAPRRPFREQRHTFRVISRSVEQADLEPVIQEKRLSLPSVPLLYLLLPYLLVFGGAVAIVVLTFGWMGA